METCQSDSDNEDLEFDILNMSSSETTLLVKEEPRYTVPRDADSDLSDGSNPHGGQHSQNPTQEKVPMFVWVLSFFAAIGGFLFGYDTGVISGAMLLLADYFQLESIWQEIVVSVTIAFAAVFALAGGLLNDMFGRKFVTILASTVFTAGALLLGFAQNVAMLVVGRGIVGAGIGLASMTVPVYIAECAPAHLRGRLVTINNLFITGGQFIASVVDGAFSYDKENGWRYMLGLAGLPSAIQFIGFFFLPESPRWLIKKGKIEQATEVLRRIRGTKEVEMEVNTVRESLVEDQQTKSKDGQSVFMRIFSTPSVRRAVFVGCGLQLIQQLSGINTVMYYSATIIKMTGVRDATTAIWLAAITAGVNFIFTLVGVWLVERIGRRSLILGSIIGVFLSLIVLSVGFQLAAFNSPPITTWEPEAVNSSCYSYNSCEDCTENTKCGFCYIEVGKSVVNGSCLPTTADDGGYSSLGRCNSTTLPTDTVWAHEYCPTKYSLMGFFGLVLYLMFFAPGMGPMPWTINSEIYPLWARSTGNSLATATNWTFNLIVSMTFLTLTETITKYGTYWLLSGIVLLGIIFIAAFVPETKGKRLEDVEELFERSVFAGCPGSSRGYTKSLN